MLVVSQYVEERYAVELLADGAEGVGYLLKDRIAEIDRFVDAVRAVGEGGSVLDPEVVAHMLGRRRDDDPLDALTPREREVLGLMAEGRTNRAIAGVINVSERAVERHVTAIFGKLDLPPARRTTGACWPCWRSCGRSWRRAVGFPHERSAAGTISAARAPAKLVA